MYNDRSQAVAAATCKIEDTCMMHGTMFLVRVRRMGTHVLRVWTKFGRVCVCVRILYVVYMCPASQLHCNCMHACLLYLCSNQQGVCVVWACGGACPNLRAWSYVSAGRLAIASSDTSTTHHHKDSIYTSSVVITHRPNQTNLSQIQFKSCMQMMESSID